MLGTGNPEEEGMASAAHPLLGTQLLAGHRLVIHFQAGTVELT
jgi:hypothetical protein